MAKPVTLKRLAQFIWSLENEFDLLNYEIKGVKVWQYQRFRIFNELAFATGLYKIAHTKKTGFFDILKAAHSLLYYSIFSNPLTGNYHRDYLIFGSGRKTYVQEQLMDIYTHYFIKEEQLENYEIVEELIENIHLTRERKNRKHQDYQQIRTYTLSRLSLFRFNYAQKQFIEQIEQKIATEFQVKIDLKKRFRNGYLTFKYDYNFYNKLLEKRKPKQIILVCSYGYKMALVAASKKTGIETIELQHGTINKYHLGYSYPGNEQIEYFPDKLYVFGRFWKEKLEFPVSNDNIIIKGFPYFNQQKEQYNSIPKRKNQILIISQGTIGKRLSEIIWKDRQLLSEYEVKYKLHPGELSRWRAEYPQLVELALLGNFEIIDHNNINIYNYFATSEFVIGVYSTAIYEALSFNCKAVLMNLPGVDYMADLIESKIVFLVSNVKDALEFFKQKKFMNFPTDYFFG